MTRAQLDSLASQLEAAMFAIREAQAQLSQINGQLVGKGYPEAVILIASYFDNMTVQNGAVDQAARLLRKAIATTPL